MVNRNKIKQFMNDPDMNNSVREVLVQRFKNSSYEPTMEVLASQMLALQLLDEAWKDLEREKNRLEVELQPRKQVGL